jgi:prepilin-type processing-associated H-X9-DG protein
VKYLYTTDNDGRWRPLPLPAALGHYMDLRPLLKDAEGPQLLDGVLKSEAVLRRFTCPSQDPATIRSGCVLADDPNGLWPLVRMSYVFNATVLARRIEPWGETPAGKFERVKSPSTVFLFADGGALEGFFGYGILGSRPDQTQTLYDYWSRVSAQFDHARHRNRINVAFVDGHAETLMLPDPKRDPNSPNNHGEIDRVGLIKGVWN